MADQDDDLTLPNETSVTVETESATANPNETPEQTTKREADEAVLHTMRKRFKAASDGWQHFRENALEDAKFRAGTWGKKSLQWIDSIQTERLNNAQPCLTINRAPGFIHQVTNQARQAHLRIQVNPVDDQGDPKVAEVFQGIIRNIEVNSLADWQYARGSDKQAEQGLGYLRLITEWAVDDVDVSTMGAEDDRADVFRQRIKIKGKRNPLRVYLDPAYEEPDASDANYGFEVSDIDRHDFKDLFGSAPPSESDVAVFTNQGDETGDWFPNGKIRVVHYVAREPRGTAVRKVLLNTGKVLSDPTDAQLAQLKDLGDKVIRERTIQNRAMVARTCTALAILNETTWADRSVPWIPVIGDELEIDGQRDFRGVIRDSKDSARVYNAEVSALVEAVGRGLKAPVVGYRGQFGAPDSALRKAWESANRKPLAFLEVEPMDIDGKPAPFPQPVTFEPPLQGVVLAIKQTDEDYKSTAGFHDASLGQRGPQEAGVAIAARQRQDELGSSHYLDNLRLALCAVGRRLINLIRVVYDVPTVIRITGADDRQRRVMVYAGAHNDPRQPQFLQSDPVTGQQIPFQLPEGVSGIYDLSAGEFDIEVAAGPNSGSRRQEQFQALIEIFKGLDPAYAINFMDLLFMFIDLPVGRQMADRAKKALPKQFQDEDQQGGQPQVPPEVVAEMQQMKEQLQQAMQALQGAQQEIQSNRLKIQSDMLTKHEELATKERIAAMQTREKLIIEQIRAKGEQALLLLDGELSRLEQLRSQHHEGALAIIDVMNQERDRQHQATMPAITAAAQPDLPPATDDGSEPASV